MSIVLDINGVDRSNLIEWPTFQWQQNPENQADTVVFQYKYFGSRSSVPANQDDVALYDQGIKVFGGTVIKIEQTFSVMVTIYKVTCADYQHNFDKYLVDEIFSGLPLINIVIGILNLYVNQLLRVELAQFETNEVWTGGAADTTNFRTGTQ